MKENNDQAIFIVVGLFLFFFLGVPAFYAAKADVINSVLLSICKAELRLFQPFSDSAQIGLSKISQLEPADLSWANMTTVLYFVGKYIRWPFAIILISLGGVGLLLSRTGSLTRKFSMSTLLANNAEIFPCLTPVVGRGDYLLSHESYDSGPWAIARSPLQFAAQHNLLLSPDGTPFSQDQILHDGLGSKDMPAWGKAVFDQATAREIFTKQLGQPIQDFSAMSPVRKVVATAFSLYAIGKKADGIDLLDSLSASYREDEKKSPQCLELKNNSFLTKVEKKYLTTIPQLEKSLSGHAFELTWFMKLLFLARKKGVLASSQFLFLRLLDRPLWYTLNQCGGRTAWTEASAAWSHYHAEKKDKKAIHEPQISGAVSGLKKELDRQGWLVDTPLGQDTVDEDQVQEDYLQNLDHELI